MDNTSSNYRCSVVKVKVFLPYPLSNKPRFWLWLSLYRALPNSRRTCPHFDLSYFPLLFTKRGLLPQTLLALHSCYTPEPTSADNPQAKQIPCLVFPPRCLNSRPSEHHYRFVKNQRPSCLTS